MSDVGDTPRRVILVPLDGSELAERALGPACSLARATAATLVALRVVPHRELGAHPGLDLQLDSAQRYLVTVADRVRADRLPTEHVPTVVTEACAGDPAERIVREAHQWKASLIVMATHGCGGLSQRALGSVAGAVLERAARPVLLIRPAATRSRVADDPATAHAPGDSAAAAPARPGIGDR
jgi:nucleotide-binding universal stress UspA family protein